MTGDTARVNIGKMLIAVSGMEANLVGADSTPSNIDLQYEIRDAREALTNTYSIVHQGPETISAYVAQSYNDSKVKYDVIRSTFTEFGTDQWPSFGQALQESVDELPDTLKDAGDYVGSTLGSAAGGVAAFGFEALKKTIVGFFKGFGWFGWLLVFMAIVGLAFYYVPGLKGKALGMIHV